MKPRPSVTRFCLPPQGIGNARLQQLSSFFAGVSVALLLLAQPTRAIAGDTSAKPTPFSTEDERCIIPAAEHHGVNYHVLRAILVTESSLKAGAVSRNSNGTVDVGMGQINSIHFKTLSKFGISPAQLLDACTATYVAAWHLRKQTAAYGNTWEAVARYHSSTPHFNKRYQILLKNALIQVGVLQGAVQPVPQIQNDRSPGRSDLTASSSSSTSTSSVVVDTN